MKIFTAGLLIEVNSFSPIPAILPILSKMALFIAIDNMETTLFMQYAVFAVKPLQPWMFPKAH